MALSKEAQALVDKHWREFRDDFNKHGVDVVEDWKNGMNDDLHLEGIPEDKSWDIVEEAISGLLEFIDFDSSYDDLPCLDPRSCAIANWSPRGF